MDRKEYELILGIVCLIISIVWGYYKIINWKKWQKGNYSIISSDIPVIVGLIAFFMCGIAGIYRYFT